VAPATIGPPQAPFERLDRQAGGRVGDQLVELGCVVGVGEPGDMLAQDRAPLDAQDPIDRG